MQWKLTKCADMCACSSARLATNRAASCTHRTPGCRSTAHAKPVVGGSFRHSMNGARGLTPGGGVKLSAALSSPPSWAYTCPMRNQRSGVRVARLTVSAQAKKNRRSGRSPRTHYTTTQGSSKHTATVSSNVQTDDSVLAEIMEGQSESNLLTLNDGSELLMFKRPKVTTLRTLVLDVSFAPVDVISWQRSMCLSLLDKVEVLEYYDSSVRSGSAEFRIPAVVKVNMYLQKKRAKKGDSRESINRRSVFVRDEWECQYCGSPSNLTIDHLIPVSKGGLWSWDNLVTACARCNGRKGNKTPEAVGLRLRSIPRKPSTFVLCLRRFELSNPPNLWTPYLPDAVLNRRHIDVHKI